MRVSDCVGCKAFPCADVNHAGYIVPDVDVQADRVSVILISEAAPADRDDDTYAPGNPLFGQTTVQAFVDAGSGAAAGSAVSSIRDILDLGVYLTTAVKCSKTGYAISAATVRECSKILEDEIAEKSKRRMIAEDIAAALAVR